LLLAKKERKTNKQSNAAKDLKLCVGIWALPGKMLTLAFVSAATPGENHLVDNGFGGGASCRVPKLLAADNIDISILGSGDRNYIRGKATKSKGQSVTTYTRGEMLLCLE